MDRPLTTDMTHEQECPYFLWSHGLSIVEFRERLRSPDPNERALWSSRLLRDARYPDVWRFVGIKDVCDLWDRIEPNLGRRRAFWKWLLDGWRDDGLLS